MGAREAGPRPQLAVVEDGPESTPKDAPSTEVLRRRADRLEVLLAGRLSSLLPWLPAVGAAVGIAMGVVLWQVLGADVVLMREATIAIAALGGFIVGGLGGTRVGDWLARNDAWAGDETAAADLTAEFRHTTRSGDPRDEMLRRRGPF